MGFAWRKIWRLPQTYILLIGAGLGYLCLIVWLTPRLIVLLTGGVITFSMVLAWLWQFRQERTGSAESNLLESPIFLKQLMAVENRVPKRSDPTWERVQRWAGETQLFAAQIAQREPTLAPELLEALYTVLGLTQQVADGLEAVRHIRTKTYRDLAQQRLQESCDRLQTTHAQLQQLQDQIVLSSLTAETTSSTALPQRLQGLIADNRTVLQAPSHPANPSED